MGKSVVIDISPAGAIKVEAIGFTGNECEKATEQIEIILGGKAEKKYKSDYYMAPSQTQVKTRMEW